MKGTLAASQLSGAIGIVIVAVLVYAARDICRYFYSAPGAPVRYEWEESSIVVELTGDRDHDGIYFLPKGATVGDLFSEAGIRSLGGFRRIDLSRVLHAGDRVFSDPAHFRISTDAMSASTRLALDMPIDLNEATLEELMLVPGIGHGTASTIVEMREQKGRFSGVDELMSITGIGGKRYERIRRYLYVTRPSYS